MILITAIKKDKEGKKAETDSFSEIQDSASWKTIKIKYHQVLGRAKSRPKMQTAKSARIMVNRGLTQEYLDLCFLLFSQMWNLRSNTTD